MRRLLAIITAAGLVAGVAFIATSVRLGAQNRMRFPIAADEGGHVALGLAIRKLNVSGTYMQCPAHPDDETNALFALYGYGAGLRVVDVQNNRGEGGQNEIGPELFRDMGVLRTSELLSAHRIDGAEQFFTRAIDYGYSWDPNEVIQKWGREEIVGDYVRLIRTIRPDVVLTMNIQGGGGDRAHEATTVLAREAYLAAGDPTKYPEQLREGLRAWQPSKLYFAGGGGGGGRGDAAARPRPRRRPPTLHGSIRPSLIRCLGAPTPRFRATHDPTTSARASEVRPRSSGVAADAAAPGRSGRRPRRRPSGRGVHVDEHDNRRRER